MERKHEQIELFGRKLMLAERTARDVLDLYEFSKQTKEKDEVLLGVYQSARIVADALKCNCEALPWYRWYTKRQMQRQLSAVSLIGHLPQLALRRLAEKVIGLERDGQAKKKAERPSAAKSHGASSTTSSAPDTAKRSCCHTHGTCS